MLKRVRQLNISLAAKCQLLFGAAVVLIIAAALFVPLQRMEQLTEQLNEKAAGAVARGVVGEHVAQQLSKVAVGSSATTTPGAPTVTPAPPATIDGELFIPSRLIGEAALEAPEK